MADVTKSVVKISFERAVKKKKKYFQSRRKCKKLLKKGNLYLKK